MIYVELVIQFAAAFVAVSWLGMIAWITLKELYWRMFG